MAQHSTDFDGATLGAEPETATTLGRFDAGGIEVTRKFGFIGGTRGVLSTLEIDAPAKCDVLGRIHGWLFDRRVQIVTIVSQRYPHRDVHRLTVVEFDGGRLHDRRLAEIRTAIATALGGDASIRGHGAPSVRILREDVA